MKGWLIIVIASCSLVLSSQLVTAEPQQSKPIQTQGGYVPPKPKEGFRYPDCFCTDSQGQRVELGQTVCLQIGSSSFTARCGMSLNTPAWRRVSEGCPSV